MDSYFLLEKINQAIFEGDKDASRELMESLMSSEIVSAGDYNFLLSILVTGNKMFQKENDSLKFYELFNAIALCCKRYALNYKGNQINAQVSNDLTHRSLCKYLHPSDIWLTEGDINEFIVLSQAEFMMYPMECIEYLEKIDSKDEEVNIACEKLWNRINDIRNRKTKSARN